MKSLLRTRRRRRSTEWMRRTTTAFPITHPSLAVVPLHPEGDCDASSPESSGSAQYSRLVKLYPFSKPFVSFFLLFLFFFSNISFLLVSFPHRCTEFANSDSSHELAVREGAVPSSFPAIFLHRLWTCIVFLHC